jgi:hypothetical protein
MGKKFVEHVVVRDYGKQGLAIFDMTSAASLGNICCWSTLVNYEGEPKGFRPSLDAPMYYGEAHISYYWKGKLVRPGSDKARELELDKFVEAYRRWAIYGYQMMLEPDERDGVELEVKVVQRDHAKFRKERWTR